MSIGYSLLAGIVAIAAHGDESFTPDYSPRGEGWPLWRGALNALGAVTFAYGGHRYDLSHMDFCGVFVKNSWCHMKLLSPWQRDQA